VVPGVLAASQPRDAQNPAPRYVALFGDEEHARQFRRSGSVQEGSTSTCFTTEDRAQVFPRNDATPVEWPSFDEAQPMLQGRMFAYGQVSGGVQAVHAEKLVRGELGKAVLEMTDAWVDPDSHGVRLIGRSTLPLVRVATGPSDIEVYAGRDGDVAQLVVTAPKLPEASPDLTPFVRQFTRLNALFQENRFGTSDCDHVRVALHPTAEQGPTISVVQTTAFLSSLDPAEQDPVDGKGDGKGAKKPALRLGTFRAVQALRKRAVNVSLSATQSSADREPVLSVAIGWASREAKQ
jgi:hypothetical protein